MKAQIYRTLFSAALTLAFLFTSGCKKFVEVDTPPTRVSSENVYNDPDNATAVLTGLFARLSSSFSNGGIVQFAALTELSADNSILFDVNSNEEYRRYFHNNVNPLSNSGYWVAGYNLLYTINDAIIKLGNNTILNFDLKNRLLGEAYFLRAFDYFYMVNLYGDVPLVLTTRPQENAMLPRSPSAAVYGQISNDLQKAEELLNINYVSGNGISTTSERTRPNLAAVFALQARVFLYKKEYAAAEVAATKVINQTALYNFAPLGQVFLKNSKETIWALQSVTAGRNTYAGFLYPLTSAGPNGNDKPFYLSQSLIEAFEPGDVRKVNWIASVTVGAHTYNYANKYRKSFDASVTQPGQITEYDIMLRLAEQYLIRAEARNEQGNSAAAVQDLNALRTRSRDVTSVTLPNPLPNLPNTLSQADVRIAVLKERRVELFTEGGHRWLDIKRSANRDAIMATADASKGSIWEGYKALYPIPTSDILQNPALKQNTGY